jgi:hypothetical protein
VLPANAATSFGLRVKSASTAQTHELARKIDGLELRRNLPRERRSREEQ